MTKSQVVVDFLVALCEAKILYDEATQLARDAYVKAIGEIEETQDEL